MICLFKSMECTVPTVVSSVHSGLWVIMMCQCRFNCSKCTILVGDTDGEGVYACMGSEDIWEISLPSA